jgi:hypothetical protein
MGARQVSWVPIAGVAWTLPSPARATRACPLSGLDRERDLGRVRSQTEGWMTGQQQTKLIPSLASGRFREPE